MSRAEISLRSWSACVLGVILGAGGACSPSLAAGPDLSQAEAATARIDAQSLYADETWLELVAYRRGPLGTGWRSQADEAGFFLSPAGRTDPRAELIATVEALYFSAEAGKQGDESPRCRFPARFAWLQSRLDLDPGADVLGQCPSLRAWVEKLESEKLTINFASAYLESPSSTFGHTFLRFDRSGTPALLSPTVNYAADSSRSSGRLAFIVRGLLGGFPGVADVLPYYRRLRTYGDDEGRDVQEYGLAMNPEQIRFLIFSLWEVKDGVFDYYFLGENCSYRTLGLLSTAVPDDDLLAGFHLDVVPIETVKLLRERGLLGEPTYRPSAIRTLAWHTRGFSAKEKSLVVALATGKRSPSDLGGINDTDRTRIVSAAAEYSSILINQGKLDLATRDGVTQGLIRELARLDRPLPPDPAPEPTRPDFAHSGRMVSLGWTRRGGTDAVELGVAAFEHELTDPLAGYLPGAEVALLSGRYRFREDGGHSLERLDLLRVESTTPSNRFFRQPAWSLELGTARKSVDDGRPLVTSLAYSHGRAFEVGIGVLALTLGASLDSAASLRGRVALEGVGRAEWTLQRERLSSQLFVEYGHYAAGDKSHRSEYGVRFGLPLMRELAMGFQIGRGGAKNSQTEILLELKQFF